jgi:predicted site-specific integrase-resolvase
MGFLANASGNCNFCDSSPQLLPCWVGVLQNLSRYGIVKGIKDTWQIYHLPHLIGYERVSTEDQKRDPIHGEYNLSENIISFSIEITNVNGWIPGMGISHLREAVFKCLKITVKASL